MAQLADPDVDVICTRRQAGGVPDEGRAAVALGYGPGAVGQLHVEEVLRVGAAGRGGREGDGRAGLLGRGLVRAQRCVGAACGGVQGEVDELNRLVGGA